MWCDNWRHIWTKKRILSNVIISLNTSVLLIGTPTGVFAIRNLKIVYVYLFTSHDFFPSRFCKLLFFRYTFVYVLNIFHVTERPVHTFAMAKYGCSQVATEFPRTAFRIIINGQASKFRSSTSDSTSSCIGYLSALTHFNFKWIWLKKEATTSFTFVIWAAGFFIIYRWQEPAVAFH